MASDNYDRAPMVDEARLAANTATETYQPHHGIGYLENHPVNVGDNVVGPISTISVGPLGIGAVYSFTEAIGHNWHAYSGPYPGGAIPTRTRAAGA